MSEEHWRYKGRVVFQGNNVKDENNQYAIYSEQSTTSNHHTSGKWLDFIEKLDGNHIQDSDVVSAYTQATLDGADTWVILPRDQWPRGKGWERFHQPCVKLKVALYGHPLAGLFWENKCRNAVQTCGFEPVPGWECLYFIGIKDFSFRFM